jgi:hypothetical protein
MGALGRLDYRLGNAKPGRFNEFLNGKVGGPVGGKVAEAAVGGC